MTRTDFHDPLDRLKEEMRNFQEIARHLIPSPGEVPKLQGMDIHGGSIPLNGTLGGDHIIYVDFKKRFDLQERIRRAGAAGNPGIVERLEKCARKAGIAILDVSGHQATDALMAAMLHQAFLLGAIYELDLYGNITRHLFENINTRFYHSSSRSKYVTMLYGEISEDTTFRFLSAAHPPPVVFSNREDRFMEVGEEFCTTFPPIGTLPSIDVIDRNTTLSAMGFKERYRLNTWSLMGGGDILLLYTDGLLAHANATEEYFPRHLEQKMREVKHKTAKEIFEAIKAHLLAFAECSDDVSFVVIKRL
jgi:serine phosphatase RsbU (regulator of sigma subunit)